MEGERVWDAQRIAVGFDEVAAFDVLLEVEVVDDFLDGGFLRFLG